MNELLDTAVELRILELSIMPAEERETRRQAWIVAAEKEGVFDEGLLLGGRAKSGRAARAFNALARAIAALAFHPGGVWLFGRHWESPPQNK